MLAFLKSKPHILLPIGLLALSAYQLTLRLHPMPLMANDFVHGAWAGLCLGLQILGLIGMRRLRNHPAA